MKVTLLRGWVKLRCRVVTDDCRVSRVAARASEAEMSCRDWLMIVVSVALLRGQVKLRCRVVTDDCRVSHVAARVSDAEMLCRDWWSSCQSRCCAVEWSWGAVSWLTDDCCVSHRWREKMKMMKLWAARLRDRRSHSLRTTLTSWQRFINRYVIELVISSVYCLHPQGVITPLFNIPRS